MWWFAGRIARQNDAAAPKKRVERLFSKVWIFQAFANQHILPAQVRQGRRCKGKNPGWVEKPLSKITVGKGLLPKPGSANPKDETSQ